MGRARLVIDELRIDEALWATASPARRAEWRGAIRDFVDENDFEHDGDTDVAARGAVALAADRIVIALEPRPTVMLDRGALQPIIDEYLQICSDLETIAEGLASPRFEALDIAKRLVHDDAAGAIQRLTGPLTLTHKSARRLFTLIVTLVADTTQIPINQIVVR